MELEALRFTYPEIHIDDGGGGGGGDDAGLAGAAAAASIALRPRCARQDFVSATLRLSAPRGYPAASPSIELCEPKGLGDARAAALLARLQAEAAEHVGGPCLGQLIELCQEGLTEANAPEGAAPRPAGAGGSGPRACPGRQERARCASVAREHPEEPLRLLAASTLECRSPGAPLPSL